MPQSTVGVSHTLKFTVVVQSWHMYAIILICLVVEIPEDHTAT